MHCLLLHHSAMQGLSDYSNYFFSICQLTGPSQIELCWTRSSGEWRTELQTVKFEKLLVLSAQNFSSINTQSIGKMSLLNGRDL